MTFFLDWPLWAQVLLSVGTLGLYVPSYFMWQLVKECRRGQRVEDEAESKALPDHTYERL